MNDVMNESVDGSNDKANRDRHCTFDEAEPDVSRQSTSANGGS